LSSTLRPRSCACSKLALHAKAEALRATLLAQLAAGRIVNTTRLQEATLQALGDYDRGLPLDLETPRVEYELAEIKIGGDFDTAYGTVIDPRRTSWLRRHRSQVARTTNSGSLTRLATHSLVDRCFWPSLQAFRTLWAK
jgi:hypothetical protein